MMQKYNLILCKSSRCHRKNSDNIRQAFIREMESCRLTDEVRISLAGCLGLCDDGPVAIVNPGHIVYGNLQEKDVAEIVTSHLKEGSPISRLVLDGDHLFNRFYRIFGDIDFFGQQMRITLRNCGIIDPESIDDYLSVRGYEALGLVLTSMTPEEVIGRVKDSGLRGRGGGGFPTGMKWELTARQDSKEKYIICNADEGDPGAFMDRSAIEGDPHSIIEGMIIGGYAIRASTGYIYIRAEYPLAIRRLELAIADAEKNGILGKNILGSEFSFNLEIRLGAGAFVCGEETALIHSIEGSRGMPRPRPPYPSVKGLFNCPTNINNVETWANIPVIILDGSDWFSSIGTERSKGTKVFALAGSVKNTGLIEVPMGTTIRNIVFDIGGGLPDGKVFKAVQIGGPSGGCLPERYLDTCIDYDSLQQAGAMMGSGGMIVIDESTCMVNLSRFFLDFIQNESCGKCTPCREGTKRMLELLTRICDGEGKTGDIQKLERLANVIKKSSLCGLGQSAPNPVLSTLENFRNEYEQHINEKKCHALVCRKLIHYRVRENCAGCSMCKNVCPVGAISGAKKKAHEIDRSKCISCGLCLETCKIKAIIKE